MREKKLFQLPSQFVEDMQNELIEIRNQVNALKKCKQLSSADPELKKRLERLFKTVSGKYSFEPDLDYVTTTLKKYTKAWDMAQYCLDNDDWERIGIECDILVTDGFVKR